MASKAMARFARISPRKARSDRQYGARQAASEALQLLQFTNKAGSPWVRKVIESAIANARVQNPAVDVDNLYVRSRWSTRRRFDDAPLASARDGRATQVQKGVSHITIEVDSRK